MYRIIMVLWKTKDNISLGFSSTHFSKLTPYIYSFQCQLLQSLKKRE